MSELYEKFGTTPEKRVEFLLNDLTEEEFKKYFRLKSFVNIWMASHGGNFDINEHTNFFKKTYMYSLRQIDSVFFKKYGIHIVEGMAMIEATEDEWKNGI